MPSKDQPFQSIDGLAPEQRSLSALPSRPAQQRPEELRVRAMTDPDSPPKYRINGVVVNMQNLPPHSPARPASLGESPRRRSARCVIEDAKPAAPRRRDEGLRGDSPSSPPGAASASTMYNDYLSR